MAGCRWPGMGMGSMTEEDLMAGVGLHDQTEEARVCSVLSESGERLL